MSSVSPVPPEAVARFDRASLRRWAVLALALLVLNFALTFHNVWPTPWITTRHELSIEIAALLLALALYSRFARVSRRLLTSIAAVLTLMTFARYGEVTAPALYGRGVNLYWDSRYLPHVAAMLVEAAHPLLAAGALVACASLVAGVFLALRLALGCVATSLERPAARTVVGGLALVLVVAYAIGHTGLPVRTLHAFSLPVTHTYWRQARFVMEALDGAAAADVLPAADPLAPLAAPRLDGADVVVQFVESYGATAFDVPAVAEALADSRASLAAAVADTGRRVVSAFVESPTFGGGSWLAHSSFMTGLDIREPRPYDLLLTQNRTTLPRRFAAVGYRPVALMPGLKNAWPEGSFYGFAEIYGEAALDYRGPEFGWWRIPDQYALARLAALEMDAAPRSPLFVFFPTISTHMPFRPTPPYAESWSRILSPAPFDVSRVEASFAVATEWTNMRPAYADTLAYTFTYVGGFLRERAGHDLVWVLLGDHQPPASVSGEGVRWDVPVHVITSDGRIADSLVARGFREGLSPAPTALAPMHELPVLLLDAFAE